MKPDHSHHCDCICPCTLPFWNISRHSGDWAISMTHLNYWKATEWFSTSGANCSTWNRQQSHYPNYHTQWPSSQNHTCCTQCSTLLLHKYHRVNKWTDICRNHDDVIKWKHFPRIWPFVRGIHQSPVYSPYKGQWRGALMFSLICAWIKGLSKQSWGWRFETQSRSLWRHCFDLYKELMKSLTIFSRYSNGK